MHVTSAAIQMSWKYRTAKMLDEIEGKAGRQAFINEMYKYKEALDRKVKKENISQHS